MTAMTVTTSSADDWSTDVYEDVALQGQREAEDIFEQFVKCFPPEIVGLIGSYFPHHSMTEIPSWQPHLIPAFSHSIQWIQNELQNNNVHKQLQPSDEISSILTISDLPAYTADSLSRKLSRITDSLRSDAAILGFPYDGNDFVDLVQKYVKEARLLKNAFGPTFDSTAHFSQINSHLKISFGVYKREVPIALDIHATELEPFIELPHSLGKIWNLTEITLHCPNLCEFRSSFTPPNLNKLLIRTPINDKATPSLFALLPQLKSLNTVWINTVSGNKTTPAELQQLKKSKPQMEISWNGVIVKTKEEK